MKVFIDTNVWLSGRFLPGLCAQLLEALIESGIDLLLDERVLDEFRRVARDKLGVDQALLARTDSFFLRYAQIVPAAQAPAPDVPDPDDAWILAAALNAGAHWFVTGDKALLGLGTLGEMAILSPRTVYERLISLR
ncbi:putative toxin-antitoxin system toxin component, PIN family [Immundisolibacter sp.]|uniref:putative toxin-antitoxin system toxin component, PIN family n=1 Tax=Immundisolibacter sp. TaxID=1934948 RepID=UPI0026312C59|nr:putative toxin-antitoxin system toxin component, PIN family [Immundisolibacter sp.]MDD3652266.1 putative toxin-antitoxin system toxin component, PIN family [Immundisolibacter sp.]